MIAGTDLARITALVLAGGRGTRMTTILGETPKVLAPVAGRPFIEHILLYLRESGVRDVVLSTGHAAEAVEHACGDGRSVGVEIRYAHECTPLGTGGAVGQLRAFAHSDPVIVLNGDSLMRTSLLGLLQFHRRVRASASIAMAVAEDRSRFGAIVLDESDRVVAFEEKQPTGPGWINAGMYALSSAFIESIYARPCSLETEVFPAHVSKDLYGYRAAGQLLDIGTPEAYANVVHMVDSGQTR